MKKVGLPKEKRKTTPEGKTDGYMMPLIPTSVLMVIAISQIKFLNYSAKWEERKVEINSISCFGLETQLQVEHLSIAVRGVLM